MGSGCQLSPANPAIQHVIELQLDNVHLVRDNPNIPSDLEQMPHLLNFIENNGTLLTNDHTVLLSETGTDILSTLTGLYPDRFGVPIANSYRYYNPDGATDPGVAFTYWTQPVYDPTTATPSDTSYNMITTGGNTPAPWVPFTRAGCNVGSVAAANMMLENVTPDIADVYGAGSPQAAEATSNPTQASADFIGIGIHCAQDASLCSAANGGIPDVLPGEPYGYGGYRALLGAKYVDPQLSPAGPLTDLNGNVIQDANGNPGFPGFPGMPAAVSLSWVAAMQEHGVPVTYGYISDPHMIRAGGLSYGPGEAAYEARLKAYDNAFASFFARLAQDGINQSNTLFIFTVDESDRFAGGPPTSASCDGVTIPCTYQTIGEINANATGLLATQQNVAAPFSLHPGTGAAFYINGNPAGAADLTRAFERAVGNLTATNPYTGQTQAITNSIADPVEMGILHMLSPDTQRNPTFTAFENLNYYVTTGPPSCASGCTTIASGYPWNRGGVSPDLNQTWLGLVGPGVKNLGADSSTWADHADIRATMMTLLGLGDDYSHDGAALVPDLTTPALPPAIQSSPTNFTSLESAYKQLNAPVGRFGLDTLKIATVAAESGTPNDALYSRLTARLQTLGRRRDALVSQMIPALEGAEFAGRAIGDSQAQSLVSQANALLQEAHSLAGAVSP